MSEKRIAIVGAGHMARVRGKAFLETGRAKICAVASRHMETARVCATELGCTFYTDDYRRLEKARPDAILIEVPHKAQDEIALWALDAGYDLLIGGSLASALDAGYQILDLAIQHNCIVEAGYQRRYSPAWEEICHLVRDQVLGEPVMAVSMALWDADPHTWYYDQQASGGMPLTHLSYCCLNSMRWILGKATTVSAFSNRKVETDDRRVREETCGALIGFENGAFASATGSYIGGKGMSDAETRFLCTMGGIQVHTENSTDSSSITVFHRGAAESRLLSNSPSPFVRQADIFLNAIETRGEVRNPPADALIDCQIAEAISISAREGRTVHLLDPLGMRGGST
jgi:myo-inositol 2-dehydrogenase/D-chiro-inositol 1-dehydrogenase